MIVKHLIDTVPIKDIHHRQNEAHSRRNCSLKFHLNKRDRRIRVCKTMFLNTLGIKEWSALNWIKTKDDRPQEENQKIKYSKQKRETVREFFALLPKMEFHYCHQSTSKSYLEPIWQSKLKLFREYEDYCYRNSKQKVTTTIFDDVMNELKIELFSPRKDQCDTCISHGLGHISNHDFAVHIQKKNDARAAKEYDKQHGKHVYTGDVQAILICPRLKASAVYYKTKLTVHNFTIYNLKTGDVDLYVWNETQADLSSNIFASIMYTFIVTKVPFEKGEEIIIFSDGCNYQNRNTVLSNAYSHLAQKHGIVIKQKYLEKGHTPMEGDSVHSAIESRPKHQQIYLPSGYIPITESA